MLISLKLFSLAAYLTCFVSASEDVADPDVVVLTSETYKSFLEENPLTMVEYYAPWCGHCKALKPHYQAAAAALKALPTPLAIAKVDCTAEQSICSEVGVQGYPTVNVYRNKVGSAYPGARTSEAIISYLKKQLLPAVSIVDAKNLTDFSKSDRIVVIGFFDDASSEQSETFTKVAESLRDDFVFATASSADAAKAADVKVPSVVLYKTFDDGKAVFSESITEDELTAFIKSESIPIMDDIGPQNYEKYANRGIPLAYLFVEKEHRSTIGKEIEKVAKDFKGKISFVYIDAQSYGGHAKNLALEAEWPAFAVEHKNQKWPLTQSKPLTAEAVRELAQGVLDGKIEPTLKSAAIPETNDEPVKVIVGKTFKDLVLDESKDVLVELYAPWCGHCKALAPTWEKLGKIVAAETDKVVIAKMDATENDVPPEGNLSIQGFPTIVLYKAKDNKLVQFEGGDRSLGSLVSFLNKNAVNGASIKVPEDAEEEEEPEDDEHDEL